MNSLEAYIFLFFDSFFANFILCLSNEMAAKLVITFGNYNRFLVFILTLSGAILGLSANWAIGKYLIFLKDSDFLKNKSAEIANAEIKWNKFLVWMLLFSFISAIANPLALIAGFLKTNFKKFLILIFIGKFSYYVLLIFANFDMMNLLVK
jgi:membrane protein YqaA with SNARE-associated domain